MADPAQIDGKAAEVDGEAIARRRWARGAAALRNRCRTALAGADAAGRIAARVLNQDEIDSLLGFDDGDERPATTSGIQAIVNSALVSYERLPMLEVVFDRLVRMMSTSMRNFTSDNVEVSLDSIASVRFGDYLNCDPAAGDARASSRPRSGTITA